MNATRYIRKYKNLWLFLLTLWLPVILIAIERANEVTADSCEPVASLEMIETPRDERG